MFHVFKGSKSAPEEEVYAENLNIRLFAERIQWTKWDSEANLTQKLYYL